jgi:hypothetical protein
VKESLEENVRNTLASAQKPAQKQSNTEYSKMFLCEKGE